MGTSGGSVEILAFVVKTLKRLVGIMGSNPYSRVPRVRLKMVLHSTQQYTLLFVLGLFGPCKEMNNVADSSFFVDEKKLPNP